uniref:PDZ domain-containing protein n=1 Tax=Seriola dumerili TaxID=41447 RepID=A0A3B4TI25_SERDU
PLWKSHSHQECLRASGVIVKTAKDGCAEGLIYGGGGKEGIFIKEVVPESPASKSLKLKQGDQVLSATVYFDNVSYEDAIQIMEHAQAYKVKLCLKHSTLKTADLTVAMLGIKMPKIKGPEFDLQVKLPDVELKDPSAKVEIKTPEIKGAERDIEGSPSKFKMPTFKLPKFGAATRNVNVEVSSKTKDIQIPETQLKSPEGVAVDITAPNIDIEVKGPEIDLSLSKKDVDMTLPEADVKLPDVEHTELDVKVEVKAPEMAVHQLDVEGSPSKFKMPTFKLPKFGVGTPKASAEVPDMDKHVKIDGADINIPDEGSAIKIAAPSIDTEGPSIDLKTTVTEQDGKGSKFKMPHFGFSMPKVKGPKIDLSLPKKDVDVTLPEAKADVKLPEVDLGKVDVSIPQVKMEVPEAKAEVKLPEAPKIAVEMKPPECEVKGPEFDLSLPKKDVDFKLPETKADVKLPEVDLGKVDVSIPEAKIEVKKPKVEIQSLQTEGELDGQGEKFKMPKFGIKMPKLKGPEFDLSLSKKDVDTRLPQVRADVKLPDAPKADTEVELEGQGSRFKMPKFGMSMEKIKGPELHLGFAKKDVDVMLPETKADVNFPDVDLKKPSAEVEIKAPEIDGTEGSPSKFKMPNFSFSMPKVKGPDIDLSLSKKHADITLPDTKAEVKLPEAPKIDVSLGKAEVLIPETKVEVKKPEVQIRHLQTDVELEGQGGKFKMPKFGISMPKLKGPEFDLSFSKKDIDVTLPEAKAEVKLPDVELQDPSAKVEIKPSGTEAKLGHVEGSPSKFKLPTFKLPKFGAATPNVSVEVPDMDKDIKVDRAGLKIPKDSAAVDIAAQNIDIKGPSLDVKMSGTEGEGKGSKFKMPKFGVSLPKVHGPEIDLKGPEIDVNLENVDVSIPEAKVEVQKPELELQSEVELDRQGSKFKMPKFGMSMPKVKGPEIDFSLSKKDVDITLPEGKAEINLPDVEQKEPSAKVEVKSPEIEAQLSSAKGSPSKFKLPTFKFPKFGVATPNVSAEVPDTDKEIKIDGAHMHISAPHTDVHVPEVKAEVYLPDVEVKEPSGAFAIEQQPGVEVDAKLKKPRFSLPRFSFSKPNVKAPEVDVSPQDINVAIPEGKVEVKGGEVEMKPLEGEAEFDGQGNKFKMPKFGITMPKVTGPEINLSLSKKDVDVTLPEAEAKVKLPDVELKEPSAEVEINLPDIKVVTKDAEGSPSKFKMPTFKLPKFGVGTPSSTVEVPVMDKDINIDGDEEVLAVTIAAPSTDTQAPSIDIKTTGTEREGKGSRFKLPSLGFSGPHPNAPRRLSPTTARIIIIIIITIITTTIIIIIIIILLIISSSSSISVMKQRRTETFLL